MKILFFGELYPRVVHGVSIANRLNLDCFVTGPDIYVDVIEENSKINTIGKASFSKIKSTILSAFKIGRRSRKNSYDAFYSVISLSTLGILKTLCAVYSFHRKSKGKIIVHLHRGDFSSFYRSRWVIPFLVKLCFLKIDRLIVLSELQKSEMEKYFPREAIFVVENTVLEEKMLPDFGVKRFGNSFVYVSNFTKEKGIFDLLSAFRALDQVRLDCYGAFAGNEDEIKASESSSVGIHSSVFGLEKFRLIHSSSALILPSWNEGQPTIILEAMLVGTPVLTTRVGLIGELLGDEYPFFFLPENPEDLAECVERYIKYEYKSELSNALRKRYFEFFSQDLHRAKLFNAFGLENF